MSSYLPLPPGVVAAASTATIYSNKKTIPLMHPLQDILCSLDCPKFTWIFCLFVPPAENSSFSGN